MAHRSSLMSVLSSSWSWAGVIVVLAVAGVIVSAVTREAPRPDLAAGRPGRRRDPRARLEQASLHTAALLNKHVGLGAWFAAIAAGYAVDRFIAAAPAGRHPGLHQRGLRDRAGLPRVPRHQPSPGRSPPAGPTQPASSRSSARWPTTARGPLLVEDPSIAEYYLPAGRPVAALVLHPQHRPALRGQHRPPPPPQASSRAGNAATFAHYIAMGYFSYVALNFTDTTALDHGLATELHHNPGYHTIAGHPLRHRGHAGRPGHLRNLEIRTPALTEVPGSVHALPADSSS